MNYQTKFSVAQKIFTMKNDKIVMAKINSIIICEEGIVYYLIYSKDEITGPSSRIERFHREENLVFDQKQDLVDSLG